jgi:hypothetical protein
MKPIITRQNIFLVYSYIKLWIQDLFDYYFIYLILSLPTYLFNTPIIKLEQNKLIDSSDEENDSENNSTKQFYVFISDLEFVFKINDEPPIMDRRKMHGSQLRPLIDERGRFFIGHIHRYYPNLDTINIRYLKIQTNNQPFSNVEEITKVLDVKKRYDIRNNVNCKFGVYL